MTVTLLRHFKVIHTRMRAYTPSEYSRALREYDEAGVIPQDVALPGRYQRIITSTLRRTSLTRELLLGAAESQASDLLNEVPIVPFTDSARRFDAVFLDIMSRLQWLANNPRQPETRRQSVERARAFIDGFLRDDLDYLLIGHGFFFRVLSAELLRQGFHGRPVRYLRNGQYEVYTRDPPGQARVRLWSLHPMYLDARGLVAVWREGLLAKAVLEGKTRGYRHHPQLDRFRDARDPVGLIGCYLLHVYEEGRARGYAFDRGKIGNPSRRRTMRVTAGQLDIELSHLKRKLRARSPLAYARIRALSHAAPHPMFPACPEVLRPGRDW